MEIRNPKKLPDPALLWDILHYDADNGNLTWKRRDRALFKSDKSQKTWNTRFAGKFASTICPRGYRYLWVFGMRCSAHRVAWAMHYGQWPSLCLDHIDGNPVNNKISNLREVTHAINGANKAKSKRNKSGFTGVSWNKSKGKWQARINLNGDQVWLGLHETKQGAIEARKKAEQNSIYTKRHGL